MDTGIGSYVATSQGTPGATIGWKRAKEGPPQEASVGTWPCLHPDYGAPASKTVRE